MREFRFRVWDEQDKKMSQVVSLDEIVSSMPEELFGKYLFHPYKWQQYTGLHDKNDKEIYEGDIVIDSTDITNGQRKWIIAWDRGGFEMQTEYLIRMLRDGNGLQVIGNIYSNPELLEA